MNDPFGILRDQLVQAAAAEAGTGSAVEPGRSRRRPAWLRRHPRPLLIAIAALVLAGSATAAVLSLTASPSQPLAGRVPGAIEPASLAGYRYAIVVTPNLQAGAAFWNTSITYSRGSTVGYGEGGGGPYPTASTPLFGGDTNVFAFSEPSPSRSGDTVAYVLAAPQVAAVRIGARTIKTFTSSQLPAGDRAAVVFLPAGSPALVTGWAPGDPIHSEEQMPPEPGRKGPHVIPTLAVLPLNANGEVIPSKQSAMSGSFPRFWQAPSAVTPNIHEPAYHGPTHPLPGLCELAQRGLPALRPEWGHSLANISPAKNSVGELFLSCLDTEYYLHGWPLEVGVLLDARHPGQTLGAIPGARPVPGHPNLVNFDAGHLSARRQGEAWLVVQGGADAAQRLRVLRALRISRLDVSRLSHGLGPH